MTIDFFRARQVFEEYLDEYDREDKKTKLKIVHTYGVVDCAEEIVQRMHLPEEDVELAKLIGLLHDIGRFEQIRRFDSFLPTTMDHAAYGAGLLFGEKKMIRRFLPDDSYDELICQAIKKHSDFQLEGIRDEHVLLHAKLIRDADKLDNCRVKVEEPTEILLGLPEEKAGVGRISPEVWTACMRRESVLSKFRVTNMDFWVSYLAQYYNVYFKETCSIIKERDYITKIVKRLYYPNPDTAEKMVFLMKDLNDYME